MSDADWRDVQASLDGDEEAYTRIVRRYEAQISKIMWRFTRNLVVCEELVQDVFTEAYFSLSNYKRRAPFEHWLKRIATFVGYAFWKKQEKEKHRRSLADIDVIAEVEEDQLDPSRAADVLQTLLEQLPSPDRLVLTLMYFENLTTREIAKRLGWTRSSVKMRAFRARHKLKVIGEREHLLEKLEWIY